MKMDLTLLCHIMLFWYMYYSTYSALVFQSTLAKDIFIHIQNHCNTLQEKQCKISNSAKTKGAFILFAIL